MKRFFYASAAVLMLAIAYQLGTREAAGQSVGTVAFAHDTGWGSYVVTPSGSVYWSYYGTIQAPAPRWTFRGTIGSSSPIVRIGDAVSDASGQVVVHAFAQNGNFYVSTDDGRTWSLRGNVFGSPTPALRESWGQLKSRYRATPPAAPGMTVTPGADNR